jgi:putative hydrolase of the HAD superfamily
MFRPQMRTFLEQDFGSSPPAPARREVDFRHVRSWIFDLDKTLYPAESEVLATAERRICLFVQNHFGLPEGHAWRLQKDCLREYGSTLAGLMRRFAIDPEPYLAFVNDVDVTTLVPQPSLRAGLARLPGRRLVFTNNCAHYAARVLKQLDLADLFDDICDIRVLSFAAKPAAAAYDAVLARARVAPEWSAMFDDAEHNLTPAHALGMTTVWLRNIPHEGGPIPPHVHHATGDLSRFLHSIEVSSAP